MKRFVLILCLMLPSWGWADNYLCIAEQAAGFKTIDGRHQATEFKTEDKYLVSEATGNVTRFGEKAPLFTACKSMTRSITCDGSEQFILNKDNIRFMYYATSWGYVYNMTDNPHIEIGTCSKF